LELDERRRGRRDRHVRVVREHPHAIEEAIMPAYGFGSEQKWAFSTNVDLSGSDVTLVADPGDARTLMVQSLTIVVTDNSIASFDIEDAAGTIEVFKAPGSLAAGVYGVDAGPLGAPVTSSSALVCNITSAAAGAAQISGFGYIREG